MKLTAWQITDDTTWEDAKSCPYTIDVTGTDIINQIRKYICDSFGEDNVKDWDVHGIKFNGPNVFLFSETSRVDRGGNVTTVAFNENTITKDERTWLEMLR